MSININVPPVRVVFDDDDRKYILKVIDLVLQSGMVAASTKVKEFEEFWAEYCSSKHAIACSSGGAALEILMKAMDIKGKDVLVPTNTFIATVNSIIFAGGNPVFLDLDPNTMCVSLAEIQSKKTDSTVGVVPVHIGGIISPEMEKISAWCCENNLWLIEDAAHAHGSEFNGKRAGKFGLAAAYSFFATKVITAAEGGMIVCDDDGLAEACRGLRDYGKRSQWETVHTSLSSNYRMNEITAVIGHQQARKLDSFLQERNEVADEYKKHLEGKINLIMPSSRSSWYKFIALPEHGISQEDIRIELKKRSISLAGGVYDLPVHQQPVFQEMGTMPSLPISEDICPRHICLPIWVGMSNEQVEHVITSLLEVLEELKSG